MSPRGWKILRVCALQLLFALAAGALGAVVAKVLLHLLGAP